jgi:hypothetical protein
MERPETAARLGAVPGRAPAAIDLKAVPGIGAEVVLTVDGELRKTRLFRSHEQANGAEPRAAEREDARKAQRCR